VVKDRTLSVALVGSGGDGIMTAGDTLLRAASKAGWYGLITRSVGPQIRGGESLAFLRLANYPVEAQSDHVDILVALDWPSVLRFTDELPLYEGTVVIGNSATGEPPESVRASSGRCESIDFAEIMSAVSGARANTIAVGVVAGLIGIPMELVGEILGKMFAAKGEKIVDASLAAAKSGFKAAQQLEETRQLPKPVGKTTGRWMISGNDATAVGALRGGIRFVAAYPITPATEILEWLSPRLAKLGGTLVQAEDELASINMCVGASFGGIPSLTATSGPGLSLMVEGIGLAVATEVPVVVVDVMRGSPSTGIPTKSEQSDLNIAVYGLSGDAPHVVIAPTSIADSIFSAQWSVYLAEAMQTPVILLSDQQMGQAMAVIEKPMEFPFVTKREVASPLDEYDRYELTESGVSPMALPGTAGGAYTADGLEHNPHGTPSTSATDHVMQLDKRERKITSFDYGDYWAEIDGEGELAVITWGSVSASVYEAAREIDPTGKKIRLITLRLIAPAQPERLLAALDGVKKTLVVEQSHSAQLYHYLISHYGLSNDAASYHRSGPLIIRPGEIETRLTELAA
jgi:2-oxoglutarate ferredoxin oxidoreductase subunit alpha|tara:strand:+ start:257 stop:1975 length:1719 start_codon:yes stop_codon:yes gene_type:complete